jgi:hypothetical protein
MKKFLAASALVGALLLPASMASAATIILPTIEDDWGSNAPVYSVDSITFTLPVGFTNAVLQIDTFSVDDRAVMELNGVVVAASGIYGPGNGSFTFTNGGPNQAFTFLNGNNGPFAPITSGFVSGLNTLTFIVNNTGNGIYGTLRGGPSSLYFDGSVTYSLGANGGGVPEPATWALMLTGFTGAGLALRGRRRQMAAAG